MSKLTASVLLIVLFLILATLACISTGSGFNNGNPIGSGKSAQANQAQATEMSANATATYGAQEFHLQLTAVAGGIQNP